MNDLIEEGDYVQHISPKINSGLRMSVEEISDNGEKAKCSHYVSGQSDPKVDWFPLTDLKLVEKADGGFTD